MTTKYMQIESDLLLTITYLIINRPSAFKSIGLVSGRAFVRKVTRFKQPRYPIRRESEKARWLEFKSHSRLIVVKVEPFDSCHHGLNRR